MAGPELAAVADLLPAGAAGRGRRLPRLLRRRVSGLAGVPERYRLQFLLLAAAQLPGRPDVEVSALAGRVADATRIPAGLAADPHPEPLDAWLKDRAGQIAELAAQLAGA